MKKLSVLILVAVSMLCFGAFSPALAVPVMLAEINGNQSGSLGSGGLAGVVPGDAVLILGYGFTDFSGGSKPLGLDFDYVLGADTQWPNHGSGSYDFNGANSSDFAGVAGMLTNGVNDTISTGGLVLISGGASPFLGSAQSGSESGLLGATPDLQGSSIDFIRLVVDDISIAATTSPTYGNIAWDMTARWQVWGTPVSVPEPATFLLVGVGLAGFGLIRKRLI